MNKITTLVGLSFAIFFLIGLATTLTRSMMIGFLDVLPVYILRGCGICSSYLPSFLEMVISISFIDAVQLQNFIQKKNFI